MTALNKKLNFKPGFQVLLVNAPAAYNPTDGEITFGTTPQSAAFDAVHLFIHNQAQLEELLPTCVDSLKPGGMLWVSYPKGSSKVATDVNRDILWALMQKHGWDAVRQVAVDEIWSALRFK